MKKVSFSRIGAKLIQGAEFVRDHADRAGNYLAIVSMVLVLGAGMFGVIRAQTEGYVDANEVFNSGQQKVYVINGDTGQNVQQFGESTFGATTLNLTGTIGGTDWYGPEAQQRGEALDLPMETRIGLLGVIDNEAMALLYNPPNISITKHLANQWLPADESSSTSV